MIRRTTIELDVELLARAKEALGARTTRAAVEEALRLAADQAEAGRARRGQLQLDYLKSLKDRLDLEVLGGESMWR